jgi:hypothetical protein
MHKLINLQTVKYASGPGHCCGRITLKGLKSISAMRKLHVAPLFLFLRETKLRLLDMLYLAWPMGTPPKHRWREDLAGSYQQLKVRENEMLVAVQATTGSEKIGLFG